MRECVEGWEREMDGTEGGGEYSTFGTNEVMYNQRTRGNEFYLVGPSEYMLMKLIAEARLHPLSEGFFDENAEENYYIRGVSDYIRNIFDTNTINGEPWSKYAAGYMWGVTGIVYNPEEISKEEASRCAILTDPKYKGQITVKDNVRDSYFAALSILNEEELLDPETLNAEDRLARNPDLLNRSQHESVAGADDLIQLSQEPHVHCASHTAPTQ